LFAHGNTDQEREKETTKETHQFGGSIGAAVGDVVGNVGDAVGNVVGTVVEDIVPVKLRDMLGNWAGRLPKSSLNSFMSPRKQAKPAQSAHKVADVVAAVEAIRVRACGFFLC
jgi:phage tail tape-measure protein